MSEDNKDQKSSDDRPQRSEGGGRDNREGGGGGGQRRGGGGGGGGGRRYKRKFCRFCANPDWDIDYKNIELMQRFVTNRGKILPRRVTGTCAKHQRKLATAIKQARVLNLMPFKVR